VIVFVTIQGDIATVAKIEQQLTMLDTHFFGWPADMRTPLQQLNGLGDGSTIPLRCCRIFGA